MSATYTSSADCIGKVLFSVKIHGKQAKHFAILCKNFTKKQLELMFYHQQHQEFYLRLPAIILIVKIWEIKIWTVKIP